MEYGTTAHNRSVTASPPYGGSGYEKPQSGLRPLCVFSPPQFFVCEKLLRSFLIANKKPSVTAGTLDDIPPKKCMKKYTQKPLEKF